LGIVYRGDFSRTGWISPSRIRIRIGIEAGRGLGFDRNGYWVVKQKTAADRFSRAVRNIDKWCQDNRHLPIDEQHKKLNEKLRGHYAYYGVTGNSGSLTRFLHEVGQSWRKWLNRRNRIRSVTWEKFYAILRRYPLAPVRTARSTLRHAANP
jgi:RNA-directed DNA polymerase